MHSTTCTRCPSVAVVKNGPSHTGKQRDLCRACGYQFTFDHTGHRMSPETEVLVDRRVTERLAPRGSGRVTGVSRSWFRLPLKQLQHTVQHGVPDEVGASTKA